MVVELEEEDWEGEEEEEELVVVCWAVLKVPMTLGVVSSVDF